MAKEGAAFAADTSHLVGCWFATLPLPAAAVDRDGVVVLANRAFDDFFPNTASVRQISSHSVPMNGSRFDFSTLPLGDSGLFIFLGRDTSIEEQLRKQLVHAEKMAAIGRLVSGVVHDLNNPLASLVGYAQMLSGEELQPSTGRLVNMLKNQAERARRIVQNFLNLAAKTEPVKRSFDLNRIVNDVLALREDEHKADDIVIVRELDDELPPAFGNEGQIEQVVLNLLVNAEDAVVAAQNRSGEIQIRTTALNDRVRLEVADNGSGIRQQDMDRIFEPFFTTRAGTESKGGTGLGLNICAEIVKDHGGELYAWSADEAGGAIFTMELAVSSDIDDCRPSTTPSSKGEALRGKSIMVIDDEVTITDLIDDYLMRFGAEVEVFNSGATACERLGAKSFDAVVCDQRMPGVNGQSLYRMVESVNRDLARRFIFLTGDVLNDRTRQFFEQTGSVYLKKPFRLEDLLHAVERVL